MHLMQFFLWGAASAGAFSLVATRDRVNLKVNVLGIKVTLHSMTHEELEKHFPGHVDAMKVRL